MYRPRILIAGSRRSGKSSILHIVFRGLRDPGETLFIESNTKQQQVQQQQQQPEDGWMGLGKNDVEHFMGFGLVDLPALVLNQTTGEDPELDLLLGTTGTIIFVIDGQDDYGDSLARLNDLVLRAYYISPRCQFEVFVHKVDGLSDDYKLDTLRDIQQRAMDELSDSSCMARLNFYLTSIYDHTIFEAFSKVLQKQMPELATLEKICDLFSLQTKSLKAFLFESNSKIVLAQDPSPNESTILEMASDLIDLFVDFAGIYASEPASPSAAGGAGGGAVVKLSANLVLYYKTVQSPVPRAEEMGRIQLVLVALFESNALIQQGLLDYNAMVFAESVRSVFQSSYSAIDRLDRRTKGHGHDDEVETVMSTG